MERSVTTNIGERIVPDFKVSINGQPLSNELRAKLNWCEVRQSIKLVDMALLNFDNHAGETTDVAEFAQGHEITIEVGYVGDMAWAFKGEIVSLEPQFPVADNPSLIVRCYDKLHRYRRGRHQRTFLNQKVSDVVTTLTSEEGLSPDVEDTSVQHEYLLQNNQTNIDFIHELARRVGYEVEVDAENGKLFFRKPRYDQGKTLAFTWGENLKRFNVRKSLSNVPTKVTTRYWNYKDKAAVSETQDEVHGDLAPDDAAPGEAKAAFGDAEMVISLRPNTSPDEAKALAWSVFNEHALQAVKGRGTTTGEPTLKPAQVIELLGMGKTWSGLYYVTAVAHVLNRHAGYSTEFEVRRTGTGYTIPPDEPPPPAPTREQPSENAVAQEEPEEEEEEEEEEPQTKHLRLRFLDEDGEAFIEKPFEIKVGSETISGKTDSRGRVVADVPADEESGEVTIWLDDDKSGEDYNWPIKISEVS